jgi:hypothetical protein
MGAPQAPQFIPDAKALQCLFTPTTSGKAKPIQIEKLLLNEAVVALLCQWPGARGYYGGSTTAHSAIATGRRVRCTGAAEETLVERGQARSGE